MLLQLSLGAVVIVLSAVISGAFWWAHETVLERYRRWFSRPPHGLKLLLLLCLTLLWTLLMLTAAIWLWALVFVALGIFEGLEPAIYFSLVAFTTLGFGDVLLPEAWRLLGGMAAANGFLLFGLITARLMETLRETRTMQRTREET